MFSARTLFYRVSIVTVLSSLLIGGGILPPKASAQDPAASAAGPLSTSAIQGPYTALPVDKGVWNEGQAALWDLNIIDFYKFFGPEQRARGHKPEQPIRFNHIIHVQQNKMECQYCHWSVSKAAYAAIPEVETCMGCHKFVPGADPASKAEIDKLKGYHERGEQVPWVKVHVMPQHVNFNHKRHVKAGVTCQECHGQVPNMAEVERVSSMKMGWCISCHRERGTSIDCYTCHR